MQNFNEHGTYNVRVEGRILVSTADGSWNIEMWRHSQEQTVPLVQALAASGSWTILTIISSSLVCPPEVLSAGASACRDATGIPGLVGAAWAIPEDVEGRTLLIDHYESMFDGRVPSRIFADEASARSWLATFIIE